MGVAIFPAASGGASVADGNNAGWNAGAEIVELISEYTTTTQVTSITISSIPQTYRKLIIQWNGIEPSGALSARLRLNGNATTGYYESGTIFYGGSNEAINESNDGFFIGASPAASSLLNGRIDIENYTSTATKIAKGTATYYTANYGSAVTKVYENLIYRQGSTTPAITSIVFATNTTATIGNNGALQSGIRVYGVK